MTATTMTEVPVEQTVTRVHRIEVRPAGGQVDPQGKALITDAVRELGNVIEIHTTRIYLIEAALSHENIDRIAAELLVDPVNQEGYFGCRVADDNRSVIEVHYLPGVMDPVAQSTEDAIRDMFPALRERNLAVRTAIRYDLVHDGDSTRPARESLESFAGRYLANPVIQSIHTEPYHPDQFPKGHSYDLKVIHIPIRDLDDHGLKELSRHGHLFLSLAEMQAIRDYYRWVGREPTDIELETLAQTWSEHCVHKTLKSTICYHGPAGSGMPVPDASAGQIASRPGHQVNDDGSVTIHNLLKSTVAAATFKLMEDEHYRNWCISVFEDNAGVVRFDDDWAVCIKVETHNHPSAIEPYGGAATGIGGCIRDVIGTGQAAMPVANTDIFCVASPDTADLPKGVLSPRRILKQVVAGVRDYGNRMGIPTVNGSVYFHENYLGNPLVYCGSVGMLPVSKCFGRAQIGDRIIVLGGATGRDGIHGATFSSAELTDSHADEFSHAVQIGNPITEKKMLDVIIQARDHESGCLFNAITDCGAGGFSSAVGEMGEKTGACIHLENAPLKYQGLSYTEIWISEAQERMVLAVAPDRVDSLRRLCELEDVPMCELGQFGWHANGPGMGDPVLVIHYHGTEVGRLTMPLLHKGIPTPTREAKWDTDMFACRTARTEAGVHRSDPGELLISLLEHPNIASKQWIIRQYDHEVQGGSVIKPLMGPKEDGPSDAAVFRPRLDSTRGIALACGLSPGISETATESGLALDGDSYWMALAAIDEAVRNVICVGADPDHIAILDNFCWPGCDDPRQLGTLVRAAEACYDGAIAYRTPFVSGKDSLNNQFTSEDGCVITIPQTLLITAMGIVPDTGLCRSMDAKHPGNMMLVIGATGSAMGGSHYRMIINDTTRNMTVPKVDLKTAPANARIVAKLIREQLVESVHDCSDGGLLVAAAEMAFAGRLGLEMDISNLPVERELDPITACFAESPGRYLLEVSPDKLDPLVRQLRQTGIPFAQIGLFCDHDHLMVRDNRHGRLLSIDLDVLLHAWQRPLDW